MCSVQSLREFISQRLTAAAAEIFSEFEKTLVQYEEVIDRQRRLLDVTCRPETKPPAAGTKNTNRTDLPQQHVCKEEEVPEDQQLCYQETNSSLDQEKPELPQMKEEDEEVCSSQEGEQLVVKQETETSMLTPTHQEGDLSEAEANTEQLYSHSSPVTERTDHEDPQNLDSGLSTDVEMNPVESHPRNGADSKNEDHSYVSQSQLDTQSCEKPFKCDVCGKTFRWKSFIEQHSRIHTGVKPYDCKTCGKKFTQKSTLVQHMRIHTGERPYSCEKCGKDFTNRSNLRTHMIVHVLEKS